MVGESCLAVTVAPYGIADAARLKHNSTRVLAISTNRDLPVRSSLGFQVRVSLRQCFDDSGRLLCTHNSRASNLLCDFLCSMFGGCTGRQSSAVDGHNAIFRDTVDGTKDVGAAKRRIIIEIGESSDRRVPSYLATVMVTVSAGAFQAFAVNCSLLPTGWMSSGFTYSLNGWMLRSISNVTRFVSPGIRMK